MSLVKSILLAAGSASVALSPVIASAAPTVSMAAARTAPAGDEEADLRGRNSGILLGLAAAAAIIVAIVLVADDDDDNDNDGAPVSP